MHRFKEPVPAGCPLVRLIQRASGVFNARVAREVTPAHASKAGCANQLPASLSPKRTAAFESALGARGASRFGANLQRWQGQFQGQSRGLSAGA
jgi:hypothetical protein